MKAVIKVLGVGGAGCNALNRMVDAGIGGIDLIAINTDMQALGSNSADIKLPIGSTLTKGQGSGGDPQKGAGAAQESEKMILEAIEGADLVFVAAGMGGGTGTGAAPYIAKLAKSRGILTVGVVTRPFGFEGPSRKKSALQGIEKMKEGVDTLIVVPNDNLLKVAGKSLSIPQAFVLADEALQSGVMGISSIVLNAGAVNRDFADVRTVLKDSGSAVMGLGRGVGEKRARIAAEMAVNSPMLERPVQGVKRLLVNFTVPEDYSLFEHSEAMDYLNQFLDPEVGDVFFGIEYADDLEGEVLVTLIASGMTQDPLRPFDSAVFSTGEGRRPTRTPVETPEELPAARRGAQPGPLEAPIDVDDITAGLPEFLRSRRQKS